MHFQIKRAATIRLRLSLYKKTEFFASVLWCLLLLFCDFILEYNRAFLFRQGDIHLACTSKAFTCIEVFILKHRIGNSTKCDFCGFKRTFGTAKRHNYSLAARFIVILPDSPRGLIERIAAVVVKIAREVMTDRKILFAYPLCHFPLFIGHTVEDCRVIRTSKAGAICAAHIINVINTLGSTACKRQIS